MSRDHSNDALCAVFELHHINTCIYNIVPYLLIMNEKRVILFLELTKGKCLQFRGWLEGILWGIHRSPTIADGELPLNRESTEHGQMLRCCGGDRKSMPREVAVSAKALPQATLEWAAQEAEIYTAGVELELFDTVPPEKLGMTPQDLMRRIEAADALGQRMLSQLLREQLRRWHRIESRSTSVQTDAKPEHNEPLEQRRLQSPVRGGAAERVEHLRWAEQFARKRYSEVMSGAESTEEKGRRLGEYFFELSTYPGPQIDLDEVCDPEKIRNSLFTKY